VKLHRAQLVGMLALLFLLLVATAVRYWRVLFP
jgi:hypothetical protein